MTLPAGVGYGTTGDWCRSRPRAQLLSGTRARAGVWAEGSFMRKFTGSVPSSCGFQNVDMGTRLPFLNLLL